MLLLVNLGARFTAAARLLFLVTLVCTALPATAEAGRLPEFVPNEQKAGELELLGATWKLTGPTYTINLRSVDDDERLNYIQRMTGLPIDPFAAPPGSDPRFISFLLLIENDGEADVGFNAMASWLKTDHSQLETPLGLTDLSFAYHTVGQAFPRAFQRVGPVLLDGAYSIRPGEEFSGLLVYRVVETKTKRFHVDVDLVLAEGEIVTFSAPYRRDKKDKGGKRATKN